MDFRVRNCRQPIPAQSVSEHSCTDYACVMRRPSAHTKLNFVLWNTCCHLVGISLMLYIAYQHAWLMYMTNENKFWFSHITEVEREISFRTEAGLYYSYFKHIVRSNSTAGGIYGLIFDNYTESWRTINVLKRFNIYQEVATGVIYRWFSWMEMVDKHSSPIFFFITCIFTLHAFLSCALFLTAWLLAGHWCAGVLTAVLYTFNRLDTTRVAHTINLRESWSLPFLWMQILCVTAVLKHDNYCQLLTANSMFSKDAKNALIGQKYFNVIILSFLLKVAYIMFTIFMLTTWQFAQFLLLLQAMVVFGLYCLTVISKDQMNFFIRSIIVSIVLVSFLHFFETMLLSSMALSFSLGVQLITLYSPNRSNLFTKVKTNVVALKVLFLVFYCVFALFLAVAISFVIRCLLHVDSDEHIWSIFVSKFSKQLPDDFSTRLYICLQIFQGMTVDVFERCFSYWLLPLYIPVQVVGLAWFVKNVWVSLRNEDLRSGEGHSDSDAQTSSAIRMSKSISADSVSATANSPDVNAAPISGTSFSACWSFALIMPLFFMFLALTILRMKYTWTPYMCILAGAGFGSLDVWGFLCQKLLPSWPGLTGWLSAKWWSQLCAVIISLLIASVIIFRFYQPLYDDVFQLYEFHDPDTVQLMQWIEKNTPTEAVFSGSMQLLAGVKLCTGRPISNHPHFENKRLREATEELYQYYARRTPEDVWSIMSRYGINYIILEDSICMIPSSDGCRLKDHLDVGNKHALEFGPKRPDLLPTAIPRFCDQVRYQQSEYVKWFHEVFRNPTFRVYHVLNVQVRPSYHYA